MEPSHHLRPLIGRMDDYVSRHSEAHPLDVSNCPSVCFCWCVGGLLDNLVPGLGIGCGKVRVEIERFKESVFGDLVPLYFYFSGFCITQIWSLRSTTFVFLVTWCENRCAQYSVLQQSCVPHESRNPKWCRDRELDRLRVASPRSGPGRAILSVSHELSPFEASKLREISLRLDITFESSLSYIKTHPSSIK